MMKMLTAKLTPIVTHTATAPPKIANILCWVTLRLAIGVSQIAVPTRRENSSPHFFPHASNPPTFFSGLAAAAFASFTLSVATAQTSFAALSTGSDRPSCRLEVSHSTPAAAS